MNDVNSVRGMERKLPIRSIDRDFMEEKGVDPKP